MLTATSDPVEARISHLETALDCEKRNWPVLPWRTLPVQGGSNWPLISGGFKAASTDQTIIMEWWTKWPDALIGIPTGPVSGLWVLTVDVDETEYLDGFETLTALERVHGELPHTIRFKSPKGGLRYLFNWAGDVRKNRFNARLAGIDVRARPERVEWPGRA